MYFELFALFLSLSARIFSLATPLASPQQPPGQTPPHGQVIQFDGSIQDYLSVNQSLGVLQAALKSSGILDNLNENKVTLFAPTDEAFNSLPTWAIIPFQQNTHIVTGSAPFIQTLMLYHLNPNSTLKPSNFSSRGNNPNQNFGNQTSTSVLSVPTYIQTLDVTAFKNDNGSWYVNDAKILAMSNCSNGYVFHISK